jgi:uncharacterized protein (TIGR03000 family)
MYSLVLMAALSGSASAPATWGCHGCHGCYGCGCYSYSCGCYGCGCYGCGGCYRYSCGCWGCGCYSYGCGCYSYGCYGCGGYVSYGCYGCCGTVVQPAAPAHGAPAVKPATPPAGGDMPPVKKEGAAAKAPAQLVVNLPAQATLTIADQPTQSTSAVRRFVSPALEPGKNYSYTLKAELERDGQKLTATKEVTVRAGETTEVTLDLAPTAVTQK